MQPHSHYGWINNWGRTNFSLTRLESLYRSDLAHGIGNLVSRLATLASRIDYLHPPTSDQPSAPEGYHAALESFEFDRALALLRAIVTDLNLDIEHHRPWQLKAPAEHPQLRQLLARWLAQLHVFATWLEPFLPATSVAIKSRLFTGPVRPVAPLFPPL
ncbi:MAG: hypothetical protein IT442_03745 [Phycisphaeraceae bacterium]|nr:hypothetical protein [Phycisphaeraceae bacterium]